MKQTTHSSVIPFSVATVGIATFASMDVFMKGLAIEMGAYNAMLWRTMISLLIAATLFFYRRQRWPEKSIIRRRA